ncbi:protein kinase [Streptomyces sp. yr375]|uniref:protein kinase domain-containing protein n=1 Tax=Streptomyces sp. yr375 TaxID=1761906 RepID=UPI001160C8FA
MVTGRYRLVESIGQGGMGRVWRATDEVLDRQVAVKEMRIDGLDPEDTRTRRERTLREARATARIDHPNVVRVYDVVDEGERLWIVMELVVGRSLEQIMAEEGPLAPHETARIGLGLVTALRQVHARGVLHRDIKPGNVLVENTGSRGSRGSRGTRGSNREGTREGNGEAAREGTGGRGEHRVVLTDFGIAAIQDAKALTMVGMLVGSPDYMAPERISGRPQGPPSDVWSLGATLCAALAGHSPFARDTTLATLHAVLYEEPQLPPTAGPLYDVLTALLQKEPTVRASLTDLETALAPIAHPPPTPTPPPPTPPPTPGQPFAEVSARPQARTETAPEETRRPVPRPHSGVSLIRAQAPTERRPIPEATPTPHAETRRREIPPDGELPGPAVPSATRRRRDNGRPGHRRTGVMAAIGVVAVGTIAAIVLASPPGPHDNNKDNQATATSPSTSPSPSTSSMSPTVEGTFRPPSLPPGAHQEAGGYAWATPKGWRRDVKTGAEVHYTSPDGTQELVAKSSLARGDLMDTWQTSEANAHQGRGYRKIRLEETTFRGRPAVVWEYAFTLQGTYWHARLLGFNESGKSYQINTWYQPETEATALKTYERVKTSFTVL